MAYQFDLICLIKVICVKDIFSCFFAAHICCAVQYKKTHIHSNINYSYLLAMVNVSNLSRLFAIPDGKLC